MLNVFSRVYVSDTKIIRDYNFGALLKRCNPLRRKPGMPFLHEKCAIFHSLKRYVTLKNATCQITLRKKYPYSELFRSAFFPDFLAFGLNTGKCGPE